MAETSNIEWTDATFNPWIGCTKVGPGCDHCYAENLMDTRWKKVHWGVGHERVRTAVSNWRQPLKWERDHERFLAEHGRRRRVFCASLADVFDNAVPVEWRADLLQLIDLTPHLDWLLLTKRIGNVEPMLRDIRRAADGTLAYDMWPRPNVWLGITVVNQEEADRDIPKLLKVPAAVRWLSMEPLLGPVDLTRVHNPHGIAPSDTFDAFAPWGTRPQIDWVVVGGESGPGARPMHPDWARRLRDRCAEAAVPFLFKQWGEWAPGSNWPDHVAIPSGELIRFNEGDDDSRAVWRVGKKAAGRHLDGVLHDGSPDRT